MNLLCVSLIKKKVCFVKFGANNAISRLITKKSP